jgi:rare lipoprotein A
MIKKVCAIILVFVSSVFHINVTAQEATEHKTGTASYYHNKFEGKKTATGDKFTNDEYTCASNQYPLGTYLKITNIANKKVVYVKVNDRMGHPSRIVDLTSRAAKDLNFHVKGLAKVKIEVVPHQEGKKQILAQLDNKSNSSLANEL